MNTSYRPQSRLMYQMPNPALFPLTSPARRSALSARQLLDVELGLFLLTQLLPTAPPDALPDLLTGKPDARAWTARQHRYLNRARLLLGHFQQRTGWFDQLERYTTGTQARKAYAISPDRTQFTGKSAYFSRSRVALLRQMLG